LLKEGVVPRNIKLKYLISGEVGFIIRLFCKVQIKKFTGDEIMMTLYIQLILEIRK